MSTAMIAMTTKSSIRVNPRFVRDDRCIQSLSDNEDAQRNKKYTISRGRRILTDCIDNISECLYLNENGSSLSSDGEANRTGLSGGDRDVAAACCGSDSVRRELTVGQIEYQLP
jgi:hypothetical protein